MVRKRKAHDNSIYTEIGNQIVNEEFIKSAVDFVVRLTLYSSGGMFGSEYVNENKSFFKPFEGI